MGETLPPLGPPGHGRPKVGKAPTRDRIAAYLHEHGPSTVLEMAGDDKAARKNISTCLPTQPDWFVRTGQKRGGVDVWRLKESRPAPDGRMPLRDAVVAYMRDHGPCEASAIVKALKAPNTVHRCLKDNPHIFETVSEVGHWGALIWRLKDGAK